MRTLRVVLLGSILFLPMAVSAVSLIPCDGPDCEFKHVIELVQNIINFLAFTIAPIAVGVVMAYAGYLYLFDGGSSKNVSKAKGLFKDAFIGLLITWGCWLIVKVFLELMGYDTGIFPKFF